jgi:hypothetical protein
MFNEILIVVGPFRYKRVVKTLGFPEREQDAVQAKNHGRCTKYLLIFSKKHRGATSIASDVIPEYLTNSVDDKSVDAEARTAIYRLFSDFSIFRRFERRLTSANLPINLHLLYSGDQRRPICQHIGNVSHARKETEFLPLEQDSFGDLLTEIFDGQRVIWHDE